MAREQPLLQQGNSKLGRKIWSFSLPIDKSCKSATALCSKACYAKAGHFAWPSVKKSGERAWKVSRRKDFVDRVVDLLERRQVRTVRIHVRGDFVSPAYTLKWAAIAAKLPAVRFYAYTRRWRDAGILPALGVFGALPNAYLWFSADAETGEPPRPSWSRGVAYMSLSDADLPAYPVDLVFRDRQGTVMRKTPTGDKVCPWDDGVVRKTRVTCEMCGYCFRDSPKHTQGSRTPLPML